MPDTLELAPIDERVAESIGHDRYDAGMRVARILRRIKSVRGSSLDQSASAHEDAHLLMFERLGVRSHQRAVSERDRSSRPGWMGPLPLKRLPMIESLDVEAYDDLVDALRKQRGIDDKRTNLHERGFVVAALDDEQVLQLHKGVVTRDLAVAAFSEAADNLAKAQIEFDSTVNGLSAKNVEEPTV